METILRRRKKINIKRYLFIYGILVIPIANFLVFWVYININTFVLAFQGWDHGTSQYVFRGWVNFRNMFKNLRTDAEVTAALKNSLLLFPWTNFVLLPVSIITAFLLYKRVPGERLFRIVFFLPSIISIVVLATAFRFMFDGTGGESLVNGLLRRIGMANLIPRYGWAGTPGTAYFFILMYCLWAGIGYNVLLLNGAIKRIPVEIVESGKIDGIGYWRELFSITLPLIGPTVSTLFIIGSTAVFTLFIQPMMLTNGAAYTKTISFIIINSVKSGGANGIVNAAAMGVFFSLIALVSIQVIKHFMEKLLPPYEY